MQAGLNRLAIRDACEYSLFVGVPWWKCFALKKKRSLEFLWYVFICWWTSWHVSSPFVWAYLHLTIWHPDTILAWALAWNLLFPSHAKQLWKWDCDFRHKNFFLDRRHIYKENKNTNPSKNTNTTMYNKYIYSTYMYR